MKLADFVTPDQLAFINAAVKEGKDIAITGSIGSGKTTLFKLLMPVCADTEHSYTTVDEVASADSIEGRYVNDVLTTMRQDKRYVESVQKKSMLFTSHIREESVLKREFPGFDGLKIHIVKDRNSNERKCLISQVA